MGPTDVDGSGASKPRTSVELRAYAALTLLAVMASIIGLCLGEPLVFFFGLAFGLFALVGFVYALARYHRWV